MLHIQPKEKPKRYICKLCGERFAWEKGKSYSYTSIKEVDELHPEKLLTYCGCMNYKDAKRNKIHLTPNKE